MAVSKAKEVKGIDKLVYIDDYPLLRVQKCTITPNFGSQDLSELGSTGIVESIADVITTSVSLDVNAMGSITLFQNLVGERAAYPVVCSGAEDAAPTLNSGWAGAAITNSGVITEADFENAISDMVVSVKEDDTLRRTIYVPNCYLTSFDWGFSVDGACTENYTLTGDSDYDAASNYADLRCYPGFPYTVSGFHIVRSGVTTGFSHLQITRNGVPLTTSEFSGVTYVLGTGADLGKTLVNLSGCTVLTTGTSTTADRMRLVAYKTAAASWTVKQTAAGVNVPGTGGVVGKQIKIYVGHSGAMPATLMTIPTSGAVLRCQSVTINGDLSREDLKELGNIRVVNKRLNTPLKLSATVEASESDLEDYARMIGSGAAYETYSTGTTAINVFWNNEMAAGSNIWLKVIVYKDRTGGFATSQVLKTITMSGLSLTSKSRDMGATSRGTVSFGFGGSYLSVAASGLAA